MDEPFAPSVKVILDSEGRLYAHLHEADVACEACLNGFVIRPTFDPTLHCEPCAEPLAIESREKPD